MGVGQTSTNERSSDPDRGELTEGKLFDLLSNQRRRYILYTLIQEDDRLDLGQLSREIAAWEDGVPYEDVSGADRRRVYTALQQSHLPKLDDGGTIEFDPDRGTIEPAPALDDIERYLRAVRGPAIPWSDYYLALTGLVALVLTGVALGLTPFTVLPDVGWMVVVVVAFGVSALIHRYYSRRIHCGTRTEFSGVELEYRESTD